MNRINSRMAVVALLALNMLIWLSLAWAISGCGGDGGDAAPGNEVTVCYLGDQIITLDSDNNVISTQPITEENTEEFYEDAGRVMLRAKLSSLPPVIAQCGSDVTFNIEADTTTTAVTTTGTVSLGGLQ